MKKLNRRDFLESAAVLGAGLTVGTLLIGCKSGGAALSCADTAGMADDDIATRTAMAYVDASMTAGQECTNCEFFTVGPGPDSGCGTCSVIKGSINPGGWCSLWAETTS
jgi:hypothetical protein